MFTSLVTFHSSSGEFVRHAVLDITDQRQAGAISARLDKSGECWMDFTDNHFNRHAMEQFAKRKREHSQPEWGDGEPRYAPRTLIHGVWQSVRTKTHQAP
jgi:hypothetical protein